MSRKGYKQQATLPATQTGERLIECSATPACAPKMGCQTKIKGCSKQMR